MGAPAFAPVNIFAPENIEEVRRLTSESLAKAQRGGYAGSYKLDPSKRIQPRSTDVAWAAGIYEGEGSCYLNGAGTNRGATMQVVQKDPWLLFRLQLLFGGLIHYYAGQKDNNNAGACYRWTLNRKNDVRDFTFVIWPYLSPRRRGQIDLVRSKTRRPSAA